MYHVVLIIVQKFSIFNLSNTNKLKEEIMRKLFFATKWNIRQNLKFSYTTLHCTLSYTCRWSKYFCFYFRSYTVLIFYPRYLILLASPDIASFCFIASYLISGKYFSSVKNKQTKFSQLQLTISE